MRSERTTQRTSGLSTNDTTQRATRRGSGAPVSRSLLPLYATAAMILIIVNILALGGESSYARGLLGIAPPTAIVVAPKPDSNSDLVLPPQPQGSPTPTPSPSPKPTTIQANAGISPLIFGANLGLFNSGDQFISSTATQNLMQQMHIKIVRVPTRQSNSDAVNLAAAQAIKKIGAVAIVSLRGAQNPSVTQVMTDNTRMINVMNQVFGNSTVYYEFGNEDDLNGVKVTEYTDRWNALVPQLKKLALNGVFIGPVNYQYSPNYLTTFLQNANPRPDAVSWHEYTCSYKWDAARCMSGLDNWTKHINGVRQVMQTTLGTELPMMITEWNYAPDQLIQSNGMGFADGKLTDQTFMSQWTSKALQTLIDNHIFASMQYSATNTAIPMVSSGNTITPQGAIFQSTYEQAIGNN
jgi:hypothetical protein